MNRILTASLIIVLTAAISAFAQPQLEFVGGDTHDWKNVKAKDSPLKTDVIIKNTGNEKLVISNVRPTCGCTTAPLDKTELKPGEKTTMHITLNVSGKTGQVSKTVHVTSNDPKAMRKTLYLKANVTKSIEFQPHQYFAFENMTVGLSKTAKVTMINNSNKKVKLSDFEISPKSLNVNIKEGTIIPPKGKIDIIANARPSEKGHYNCYIKIKTSDQDYPELKIRGFGTVNESVIFNN